MTKPERLDCVAAKRRAQRQLVKALAGKSPEEQVRVLRRLASQVPVWKELSKAHAEQPARRADRPTKRRSTG